jgi:hypothetical protein
MLNLVLGVLLAQADQCTTYNRELYGGSSARAGTDEGLVQLYNDAENGVVRLKQVIKILEDRDDHLRKEASDDFAANGSVPKAVNDKLARNRAILNYNRSELNRAISQLSSIKKEMTHVRGELRSSGCTEWENGKPPTQEHHRGNGNAWAGNYAAAGQTFAVSGSGETISFVHHANGGSWHSDEQGTCQLNGTAAVCEDVHGVYDDGDKTVDYHSKVALTLSGTAIGYHSLIETAPCDAKKVASCNQLGYTPSVHAGAEFSATFTRVP